jgi:uncharacterized protein YbjT (DUF2867 family)
MILVTGATGNVGGEVVNGLIEAGQQVRALVRDPSSADLPDGVEVVGGDLNRPTELGEAFTGVDAVFLMAGFPDPPGLLATMHKAGVSRVVLLSTGAVVGGDLDNYVVRFNVVSEAAVRDSELDWTVLRPSGFMANSLRWLPQMKEGDVVHEAFGDVPVASIDPFDIAAVAVLALTEPDHAGHSYRLTGPVALLPEQRLKILAGVLGRDLRFEAQPDDEARQEMSEAMPAPLIDAFFQFFRAGGYDDSKVDPTAEQLLGRPLRSFEDWARAHRDDFA